MKRSCFIHSRPASSALAATLCLAGAILILPAARAAKNPKAGYEAEANPAYANVHVVTTADPSNEPAKSAGFTHPGVLVNRAQLAEIKRRVDNGIEPQKSAFAKMSSDPLGSPDYKPRPWETVACGPYSKPDLGCKAEQADSDAAYTQALLWCITGKQAYADKAIEIMNGWARTLTGGHTYANGPVQAAWCASTWARAAEIIRYSGAGWTDPQIAKFQNMLRTQYLPSVIHGDCENGNKELSMCEALVNCGVFLDDRDVFDLGVQMWRGRTPAYIYLKSDGPKPIEPPGCGPAIWGTKGFTPEFVDGLTQETARDAHHPWLAISSMVNAAETARQQGVDLYAEQGDRIVAALEFVAEHLPPNNVPAPPKLTFEVQPTWEIAYNNYHNRLGRALPMMAAVLPTIRPTGADHQMAWETLTHADVGAVGLGPVNTK